MEEFVKETEEVMLDEDLRESYDKEWALKDEGRRDGIKEGIKVGKEEGMKAGKEEGSKTKAIEIARKMKENNEDIKLISEYTGLSEEEVENLDC